MANKTEQNMRYPPHLKGKVPIINLPLYNTDKSIFTFFSIEENSCPLKEASCNFCGKKLAFIQGSTVFSAFTSYLKFHLKTHPEQFDSYLGMLAANMMPDNRTKYQHFLRMEAPKCLPDKEKERRWEENRMNERYVAKNLAGEPYENNDYYSKQNYKGGLLPQVVDGQNVRMIEYIYRFTNQNVPLFELVGTWNVNNYLDRRYLRYKVFLQNTGNMTLDLERLFCEYTCFLDPDNYESCPNNHTGDISIFGDRKFQEKIKHLDDELEKYPELINDKSFNSDILKNVRCIQKDNEALLEMNRLLKIILSMITVKKDLLQKMVQDIIENNTSDSKLVKPHFAIQLWGPKFVNFDEKRNNNTKDFPEHLYHTYQHVDDKACPAYQDSNKIVLKEPTTDEHGNAIYPCNVGGCQKHCECNICNFSGDEVIECRKHYPDHPDNFDEEEDIVIKKRIFFHEHKGIRFERPYQNSFWRPKDLKLAGMKKNCDICKTVVLDHSRNHHSFTIHSELCQICCHIKLLTENSMALTCFVCKKKFENIYRHKDHLDVHYQENRFSCDQCSKIFPTNFTRERHVTEIHGKVKSVYFCELCDSRFTSERNLNKHIKNGHSEATFEYSCNLCDSKFKRRDNLNQHSKEVHNLDSRKIIFRGINDQGEQFQCSICDCVFRRKNMLERHMATVHAEGSRSFQCHLCDQTFNRKDNLKRHVDRAHMQKEVYLCDRCEQTFSRKEHLRRHEQLFCNKIRS